MKKTIATAAAAAFALIAAPTAQADDQGYLNQLAQNGVPMEFGPEPALNGGRLVCTELGKGKSPDSIATMIDAASGLVRPQADAVVAAAIANLCAPPPAG